MTYLRRAGPWVWLIFALLIIGGADGVAAQLRSSDRALAADNSRPDGALALRLWLDHLHYRVTVAGDAPDLTRLAPQHSTLMLLAANAAIPANDVGTVLRWVRRGGRMVLVPRPDLEPSLLQVLGLKYQAMLPGESTIQQPLLLAPPAARLHGSSFLGMSGGATWVPVAGVGGSPVLLRTRLGQGTIWALSDSALLENSQIAQADNRRLALNLAGTPAGAIVLDEYVPSGPAGGVTNWLTQTVWGVVLGFGIAVVLLYLWLSGWRLGPPIRPLNTQYRAATEYVVSLAGLLRRGRTRSDILALYQQSLRRALGRRYGTEDNLNAETRQATENLLRPRSDLSETELVRLAAAIVAREQEVGQLRD